MGNAGNFAYVAKAPAAADVCANGPAGWDKSWAFPGPPWAPGWPLTYGVGFSVVLAALGTVTINTPITVTANCLFNGLDDSTLQCHAMQITATLNGSRINVRFNNTDPWSLAINDTVRNYSGAHYGISRTVNLQLDSSAVGKTLIVSTCVISLTPPLCNTQSTSNIIAGNGPIFNTQPQSQAKLVGQTATFTSSASGTPAPTYQWSKNAGAIGGATSANYTTPVLAMSDDQSVFKNTATNASGSVDSNNALLTVTPINGVIIYGGYNNVAQSASSMFYVSGNTWYSKASLPTIVLSQSSAVGPTYGYSYSMSGEDGTFTNVTYNYQYSAASDLWSTKTAVPRSYVSGAAAALGSIIYALSNVSSTNFNDGYTETTDAWSVQSVSGVGVNSFNEADGAATVGAALFYIAIKGGTLSFDGSTWTIKTTRTAGKNKSGYFIAKGTNANSLMVFGGIYTGFSVGNFAQEYNTAGDSWAAKSNMPVNSEHHRAIFLGSKIYIVGGYDGTSYLSGVYQYDDALDTYVTETSLASNLAYQGIGTN